MSERDDNPYAAPQSPTEPRPETGRSRAAVGWVAVIVTLAMIAILAVVFVFG